MKKMICALALFASAASIGNAELKFSDCIPYKSKKCYAYMGVNETVIQKIEIKYPHHIEEFFSAFIVVGKDCTIEGIYSKEEPKFLRKVNPQIKISRCGVAIMQSNIKGYPYYYRIVFVRNATNGKVRRDVL